MWVLMLVSPIDSQPRPGLGRALSTLPGSQHSFGSPRPVLSRRLARIGFPIDTEAQRTSVPLANPELRENMGLAPPSSVLASPRPQSVPRVRLGVVSQPSGPPGRDPRPPPPDRCPPARSQEATEADGGRSHPLGVAVCSLGRLAVCPGDHEAGNCDCLASPGLSAVLDVEGPAWPTRATRRSQRRPRPDSQDEPGQPALGCSPHSRRTAQARYRHRGNQRRQVHGPAPEAAVPDVAHLPGESPQDHGVGRLLHRADDPVSGSVCVPGVGPPAPPDPALRRHGAPHRRMDRPATPGGLSVGYRATLSPAGPRPRLRQRLHPTGPGIRHPGSARRTSVALATGLHRAGHRLDPARVPGSCDRRQRSLAAPHPRGVPGLLQPCTIVPTSLCD